jgi:hypothetical protein
VEEPESEVLVPLQVGDGATLFVSASPLQRQHDVDVDEMEIAGRAPSARAVVAVVRDFAHDLTTELAASGVGKFTVEFGCEMAVESGQVFAVLAKGAPSRRSW